MLFERLIPQTRRLIFRRNLSKSSQKPTAEKKHYRLWSLPGMLVERKDILAKQHTVYWHPGLNTGIDDQRSIYALRDGIMIVTEEEFDPDWDYGLVAKVYCDSTDKKMAPTHMRYIHVIPKRPIAEYKLIDVV